MVNNRPHVSEATGRRVQEAITTTGYVPNEAARALVARQLRSTADDEEPDPKIKPVVSARKP
ncbi:hypothetical protein [Arthrobacter sp. N1]|uniref:hypothetical protein n=1 Tax=Arthrobacter sp. N1 TaxID=619291 RepID=UPI003BAEF3E6